MSKKEVSLYDTIIENLLLFFHKVEEEVIEQTQWKFLTDEAFYYIDQEDNTTSVIRKSKHGDSFPLLYIEEEIGEWKIFMWKEDGWTSLVYEDIFAVDKMFYNSFRNYNENKDKDLIIKDKVPFKAVSKSYKKSMFEDANELNLDIKGLLDDELIPAVDIKPEKEVKSLSKEYLYAESYERWANAEYDAFNHRWSKVYEGLKNKVYYHPKDKMVSMVTKQKSKLIEKPFTITTVLPFSVNDEEKNNYIVEFCKEDELEDKLGLDFNLQECLKKTRFGGTYICASRFDEYYYRLSHGMVFSCTSLRKKDWKYVGIIKPGEEESFKVI